jgi:hypothetical protein
MFTRGATATPQYKSPAAPVALLQPPHLDVTHRSRARWTICLSFPQTVIV